MVVGAFVATVGGPWGAWQEMTTVWTGFALIGMLVLWPVASATVLPLLLVGERRRWTRKKAMASAAVAATIGLIAIGLVLGWKSTVVTAMGTVGMILIAGVFCQAFAFFLFRLFERRRLAAILVIGVSVALSLAGLWFVLAG